MTGKEQDVARELKSQLSKLVTLLDFRIYGSRARGDADADSDLDVFVEVESLGQELKREIRAATWEVGFRNFMVISTLIFTRYEMEQTPMRASPLVGNILREGVRI